MTKHKRIVWEVESDPNRPVWLYLPDEPEHTPAPLWAWAVLYACYALMVAAVLWVALSMPHGALIAGVSVGVTAIYAVSILRSERD